MLRNTAEYLKNIRSNFQININLILTCIDRRKIVLHMIVCLDMALFHFRPDKMINDTLIRNDYIILDFCIVSECVSPQCSGNCI